ncbi:hypothetical protein LWC34_21145 [Kibdelosporangium philippinense]|uniref:Uncharacterized protein n=1 Tax=Kibdelosporangium philippinense TaxID=211113 RepID=A0ABS8ZBZ6_9PSEU|nr:hypothetical protein [Kibdelosporangium philippinense]MCE7005315.1 hypothetical protein [Kibdelosporangium philippinense]
MDEKKLSELFNDAVRDVPPATFGTSEVKQASHRATIKRRNTVVATSALAFVLVAGGTVTAVTLSGGIATPTAANAPAAAGGVGQNGGTMERREAQEGATALDASPNSQQDNRTDRPKQGGDSAGTAGAAGSTPSGCQADQELAAALAGELLAAPAKTPVQVPFGCPPGSRGAAFKITEGTRTGTISIVLTPQGSATFAPLGSEVYGTANAQSPAKSGGTLNIVSQPDPLVQPAEAPYTDELSRMAAKIAPSF